jgi:hypothetical protein
VTCIVSEFMQQTSKTYVYKLLKPALKVYLKKAISSYEVSISAQPTPHRALD